MLVLLLLLVGAAAGPGQASSGESVPLECRLVGPVDEGRNLLATTAPSLEGVRWLDGKPHPLGEDKGKVVLVRWWTSGCAFCENTAPALRALRRKHGEALVIRAIFHPKPRPGPYSDADVTADAERLGLPFVVGVDPDWTALRRWWIRDRRRSYTSVSFLLDQEGRFRLIHSGSEFHAADHVDRKACRRDPTVCEREFRAIDEAVSGLLRPKDDRPPPPGG